MSTDPTLDRLAGQPELSLEINGRRYHFSELPIESLARLQSWVKDHVPNPLEAVKPLLGGLPAEDRQYLLDQARRDALGWPPVIGTAAGAAALLSTEPGQIEALHVGLAVHQPETTPEEARRIFRVLSKDARKEAKRAKRDGRNYDGEGSARDIFAVLFGLASDDEDLFPK